MPSETGATWDMTQNLLIKNVILRRIPSKSFWSSCVRFTFADLLTNTVKSIYILIKAILGPTYLSKVALVYGTYLIGAWEVDI